MKKTITIFLFFIHACFAEGNHNEANLKEISLNTIIVTATREEQQKKKISMAVDRIEAEDINKIKPGHPSEVFGRIAGVLVNDLSSESHFTAIRNKLSTGADYLFLENGIPTRSTGFFNHNALYEINVPQAAALEVTKGPGSALYGSDALHGTINILTGEIPDERLIKLNGEYSFDGWVRHLVTYGDRINDEHAFRLDTNITHNEGWRDYSDYSRQSFTGQWLWTPSDDFEAKTVLTYSSVKQSSVSGLSEDDWKHNPEDNYYQIPGREVESLRLSSQMTKYFGDDNSLIFTPYLRYSTIENLIPTWRLSSVPSPRFNRSEIWDSGFRSYGAQTKYRQEFDTMDSLFIVGMDFDYSPGYSNVEETTLTRRFDSNGNVYFEDFERTGNDIYDFDATYTSYSPYAHFEFSPLEDLRFDIGLRYDYARFKHDNKIDDPAKIGDQTIDFEQLSPKFGMTYQINDKHTFYGAIRRGFRAPSANDLFRAEASEGSTSLEPTTIDNYEVGFRGNLTSDIAYETAIYYMKKKNDIVTYRDPLTREEYASNNGETSHKGLELTLAWKMHEDLTIRGAWSYSKHEYEKWDLGVAPPWNPTGPSGTDLEGNTLARAPKYISNLTFDYHPEWMNEGSLEMEMNLISSYYTNEENSDKYGGYEVFNFRANYPVNDSVRLYARVMNIFDRRYSTNTSSSSSTGFFPGMPRTLFFGFELKL